MRLKAVKLTNFRGYRSETLVPLGDLVALIGKNDAGKSTILDALAIFFESKAVKFEKLDLCVDGCGEDVRIGCIFDDLPGQLVIDSTATTSLADEYLLNRDGDLEIHKVWNCGLAAPKPRTVAVAQHPVFPDQLSLLLLKHQELTRLADEHGISDSVDRRSNVALRRALWAAQSSDETQPTEIPLDKEDAKMIWERLAQYLPVFALFRSDRPSTDQDAEAQDPMKLAVEQAVADVADTLVGVEKQVRERVTEVASRTLRKLRDYDEALADDLRPDFLADRKWAGLFKMSLEDGRGVPVNKRGSGVRRLILLSFFQAEAERRREEAGGAPVILAIEEPETSQHPENQKILVEAFGGLAQTEGVQVILSTHVPALAQYLPLDSLRYVSEQDDGERTIESGGDELFARIADDLGVLPDSRVRVLVCVEGPHDVTCLVEYSRVLRERDSTLPDLAGDPRVAFVPMGGSVLRDWVNHRYLSGLNKPEVHIYDRGAETPPKYEPQVNAVNRAGDGSIAFLTTKGELENYLHEDAVSSCRDVAVAIDDFCDVPERAARAIHEASPGAGAWELLDEEKRAKKRGRAKRWLNSEAAAAMTLAMLDERQGTSELTGWMMAIRDRLD